MSDSESKSSSDKDNSDKEEKESDNSSEKSSKSKDDSEDSDKEKSEKNSSDKGNSDKESDSDDEEKSTKKKEHVIDEESEPKEQDEDRPNPNNKSKDSIKNKSFTKRSKNDTRHDMTAMSSKSKINEPVTFSSTLSTITQEMDDLSDHLSGVFKNFNAPLPEPSYIKLEREKDSWKSASKLGSRISSDSLEVRRPEENSKYYSKFTREVIEDQNSLAHEIANRSKFSDGGILINDEQQLVRQNDSRAEAIRAVQDYKLRDSELKNQRDSYLGSTIKSDNVPEYPAKYPHPQQISRHRKPDDIINSYYQKIKLNQTIEPGNIHSLYKSKHVYVEKDTQKTEKYSPGKNLNRSIEDDNSKNLEGSIVESTLKRTIQPNRADPREIESAMQVLLRKAQK